jgi:transport and Golgi organization protein 2
MCTFSIVPHDSGFRVMSNRDERLDRASAFQPHLEHTDSRALIMPIDPVGGGSWIGVNDAGLVAAVLNRHDGPPPFGASFSSRGALVRRALGCESIESAMASVGSLDPTQFQPFRLVLVQKHRIALVAGNLREFANAASTLGQPFMFTASSLGDVFVDSPRRRLFEFLMGQGADRLRAQSLFHRHQWPGKQEISVLMERADAATVSRTTIDVRQDGIDVEYESLVPGRTAQRLALQPC